MSKVVDLGKLEEKVNKVMRKENFPHWHPMELDQWKQVYMYIIQEVAEDDNAGAAES